ncbi:MAG: hypothetical protein JRM99_00935 [Nitrososphaerota archaeon]|nr:hypothetical protein [Nitrososphaerota archaeon]
MRRRGTDPTRFVADAMLGSLARKLRALGFDTTYYRTGGDQGLLDAAVQERRVILTSDRALAAAAGKRNVTALLMAGRSDGDRVSAIAAAYRRMGVPLARSDPFCSLCGGELEALRRADVAGRVPGSVERRHRAFFRCAACDKLYWRGSHWKKLRSLARRLS